MNAEPKAGGECPKCHYVPLYEDLGYIVCPGCDSKWELEEEDSNGGEHQEEEW